MRHRLISLLLTFIVILGMIPSVASAASTPEEALGEVNIYSGGYSMKYLAVNGRVQTQSYTYFLYSNSAGEVQEIPAYCVTPNQYGVPQTVPEGESIEYLAEEKASDPKVVGLIANMYPHRSLEELGLDNKYQAFYAGKIALWCYLIPEWDIRSVTVAPGLTGSERAIGEKLLDAATRIYTQGMTWDHVDEPQITVTPDREQAYPITIDGEEYLQQIFTVTSDTWVVNHLIDVAFQSSSKVPVGTRITDMEGRDLTQLEVSNTGNGYSGQFKVLYPAASVEGQSGSVQLTLSADVYQYAVFYALCQEVDEYGNLQDYLCDTDPKVGLARNAISNYNSEPGPAPDPDPEQTALKITKYEAGTTVTLAGATFEVVGPDGDTVGVYTTPESGTVTIPLTEVGNYTIYERVPPAYHLLDREPVKQITVKYGEVAEVSFENEPYGDLRIEKIDGSTGAGLAGAQIQIKHIESGATYSGVTGTGGSYTFTELKPGAYEIQELAAPEGWQRDPQVYTTTVVTGECVTYTLKNEALPGLRIVKYDRLSHETMSGVTFRIWRDGELLGDYETDALGEILLVDCKPGTYLVQEVDTGDSGHLVDSTPQEIELKAGDSIKELYFFNDQKPGIRLVKVDSADPSKVIPNARFRIEAVDGSWGPAEFTTDQNGEIDLSELEPGAYVVTELECPGYIIDEAQRIIHLDPNENAQFVFTNSVKPSLHLVKLSSDGSRMAGVTFRIARIEDGSHYLDRTTNSNGEILISDLEPGVYSLKETGTAADHIIDPVEYHVELFPGQTSTIILENDRRPNLTVVKRDADTGAPVPGTVFLVEAADGHSVDEIKTGPDGTATLRNLLPGVYEITEKSVPSPYLLDAPSQLVTLYPNRDHTVYFENHRKPSLTIEKIDSITGNPIKGAKFQIWYASNSTETGELNDLGTYYTDENGQIFLENVNDGWFKVTELEPAPGYQIKAPATQECFIEAGTSKTLIFENTPLSALIVYKYDSVTGEAVEGAVFQIKYLGGTSGTGGTVIGTYKTSANGSFTVTGLEAGTYVVEELASDSGHVIDTAPQTAYISGKEQDVVELYFGNSPKGSLLIKKIDASTREPLSDVQFFVTESNGTVVGDSNGYFTTDSAGTILIEGIDPGTTLVAKETIAKEGYLLDDTPQTAEIKAGQTVTLEFRNQPKGSLVINKLDSVTHKPLEGVEFEITYSDGSYVDAGNGSLSSKGLYHTDKNGQIMLSGITGTVVVTETKTIEGYTIDEETRTQTVVINPNDTQTLTFYNTPSGSFQLIKEDEDSGKRIGNCTFEIRRLNDALVGTYTTGSNGTFTVDLEEGSYYAVEVKANSKYRLDDTPHYFEVADGETTTLRVTNERLSGILLHKIDSTTGEGIYGVKFLLYDKNKNPIGEFTTDDDGYIYITADDLPDGANTSGRFYLRELEAAEGYELDVEYKTVYVKPGRTAEIEWENTPVTGQIQVYKYAAEYNTVTGTPAGTPLQGAVYEISNARTGEVVDYITTDARGVAASKPLPLTRYKLVEVTAPAYWQVDSTVHDVTLEYSGQIIKLSAYDKPARLGVTITKRGNAEVLAGNQMRYDFTVANTSNVPLDSFFWHDRIPTDAAAATVLTTGTYSTRLNYRILYKTNYQTSYQVLASNLLTTTNYSFALNAIPKQAGEVVTDIYFDFGKVPAGFQSLAGPTLTVNVSGTAVNGYQLVNRADAGGKYQGTWQTAQTSWVTIIRKYTTTPQLPKTGY